MKHIVIKQTLPSDYFNGFGKVLEQINKTKLTYEMYVNRITMRDTYVYVARHTNGLIVATATLIIGYKFGGSIGLIEDVAVLPTMREFGIGKLIVKHAIYQANLMGCYKVILTCKDKHIDFYEKCGMDKYQNCMCVKF